MRLDSFRQHRNRGDPHITEKQEQKRNRPHENLPSQKSRKHVQTEPQ